jgi:16S rRNA G527 N7-methylase RsmG
MAYKRRASQIVADAQKRATNLKAVDPNLDLGDGLTVAAFEGEISAVQEALEKYNKLLAKADAAANELNELEKKLGTLSGRMLAGVGVKYGKDSSQYEMAGGVRTSEIKRGGKKEKPEK